MTTPTVADTYSPEHQPAAHGPARVPDSPTAGGLQTGAALRQLATDETTTLLNAELAHADEGWRAGVASMSGLLRQLQQACDLALDARLTPGPLDVSPAVDKIVAAAMAEAQAAADRARARYEAELVELRARRQLLEGSLEDARDKMAAALTMASRERNERAVAEGARGEAERHAASLRTKLQAAQSELSSLRAELAAVDAQLTAERAKRARLDAALQSVHQVVEQAVERLTPPPTRSATTPDQSSGSTSEVARGAEGEPEASSDGRASSADAAPARAIALFSPQQRPDTPSDSEVVEWVRELLDDTEALYHADSAAGRTPGDMLAHLTANLSAARERCDERFAGHREASSSFEVQVRMLLNSKSGTSFGRHLGIALHDLYSGAPPASWTQIRLAG
jgi:hypothetical protein